MDYFKTAEELLAQGSNHGAFKLVRLDEDTIEVNGTRTIILTRQGDCIIRGMQWRGQWGSEAELLCHLEAA